MKITKNQLKKIIKEQIDNYINESNEMRGAYQYEYDFRTNKFKIIYKTVMSELYIGLDEKLYNDKKDVLDAYKNNGKFTFYEYPNVHEEEMRNLLNTFLKKY